MKIRIVYFTLFIGLVLSILGCSSLQVSSTKCSQKNYAMYRTFNWLPQSGDTLEVSENDQYWRLAKENLQNALIREGFEHMLSQDVDFFLAFQITNIEMIRGANLNRLMYKPLWGNYGTQSLSTKYYTQGTMILDVIDATTHEMVWRGTVTGVVGNNNIELQTKLKNAAEKLAGAFKDCVNQ